MVGSKPKESPTAVIIIIVLTVMFSYLGVKFTRWTNWNNDYRDRVKKTMQPLVRRIEDLERRVDLLEAERAR